MTISEGSGLILFLLVVVAATTIFYERFTLISATPVLPWTRRQVVSLLKSHIKTNDIHKICDLGCGWGGMIGKLAYLFPNAHITGYELSPFPYGVSFLRNILRQKRVTILKDNFFKEELKDFDLVFCYLSPHHMNELTPQLSALKSGSWVISCSFPIEGWTPVATGSVWSIVKIPVFLYQI